jgi:hypothetical protein
MIELTPMNVIVISTVTLMIMVIGLWDVMPVWMKVVGIVNLVINTPLLLINTKRKK